MAGAGGIRAGRAESRLRAARDGDVPEADARLPLPAHGADLRDLRHPAGREIRRGDPEPGTGPPGLRREHGPAPPRDHPRPHAAAPARLSADDDRDPGPDLRERPAAETSRRKIPSPSGGESR